MPGFNLTFNHVTNNLLQGTSYGAMNGLNKSLVTKYYVCHLFSRKMLTTLMPISQMVVKI